LKPITRNAPKEILISTGSKFQKKAASSAKTKESGLGSAIRLKLAETNI